MKVRLTGYRATCAIRSVVFKIDVATVNSILYWINENGDLRVVAHTHAEIALRVGMAIYWLIYAM